ncbi:DegT/DnrJ/EryC1/StrS family aminotransferase [Pseudarthrobacter oxydans]|uniref:DegT/DnrJ/EryC1/StrS family aminotransferase n=1 Tax=Pseudarthrobacter oxydans TaxID=1671 RepID=UPI003804D588
MKSRIYMSAPDVGELEEKYMSNAFRSGWIAPLGPDVDKFEAEVAHRVGRSHAVALSSGTAALHLGLLAHNARPGTVCLTSTMTFAATANAISYTGAEPVFVDCEASTGNMDPVLLERAIESLISSGETISAIVPVDLLGKAVNYTAITGIAAAHGIPVIADAAESMGATHAGRPAGAWGDAAIFSFNGNKIMTTSGGGMLLTDDEAVASRVRHLATQARQPAVHYEHAEIGYNYRLSNLLAALGRAQLVRLDEMIQRRRDVRERYKELFAGIDGVEIFGAMNDNEDNCWLTSIVVNPDLAGFEASDMMLAFGKRNIESRPLWKPMHLQPVFAATRSYVSGSSEQLFKQGITLPSGSSLTGEEVDAICELITGFIAGK